MLRSDVLRWRPHPMKILSVCIHPHEPSRLRGSVRLSLADLSADPTDPVDLQ